MERDKALEAIQIAIQMEIDGKGFYQKQGQNFANQPGRDLFRSLAVEEDMHRLKFEGIYNAIRDEKGWPEVSLEPGRGKKITTLFATAAQKAGSGVAADATELDAVTTAIEMETRSYDLYQERVGTAAYDAEREFYRALAAEEREHHLTLLSYYEYLKDPASWFVDKEHPSLDGG